MLALVRLTPLEIMFPFFVFFSFFFVTGFLSVKSSQARVSRDQFSFFSFFFCLQTFVNCGIVG